MTLKTIAQKLPAREFIRAHRSYIVPISKIRHISKSKIKIGDKESPIGVSYSESFSPPWKTSLTDPRLVSQPPPLRESSPPPPGGRAPCCFIAYLLVVSGMVDAGDHSSFS